MAVERRTYDTPFGEIWLWGEAEAFDGDKPLVLVILGAFNKEVRWPDYMAPELPAAATLVAQLPGNHCPQPLTHSVGAYAAAFSQVLGALGRPAIVVGCSVGGLVAMAMRAPNLKGLVLLEPPLRTGKLWPLVDSFRERMARPGADRREAEFITNVFGISATGHQDRDYSALVERIAVPTIVMFAEDPLFPEREVVRLPSLLDEPERDLFRRRPGVATALLMGVGHNLVNGNYDGVLTVVRRMLATGLGIESEASAAQP